MVISGLEEGRLIHLGVVTHEAGARGRCLLIDLGGGSCEVTVSDGGHIQSMVSMPLGAVRLQQEFLQHDPPAKEDVGRLRQFVNRELGRAEKKLGRPAVDLVIATSGTAAALAEASVALRPGKKLPVKKTVPKDFVVVKPGQAATADVRLLADRLLKMTNAQREAVPGIGPNRSEIIIGGAVVYAELLERFGAGGVSLLAAGAEGWGAGADAGGYRPACGGSPEDRAGTLGRGCSKCAGGTGSTRSARSR